MDIQQPLRGEVAHGLGTRHAPALQSSSANNCYSHFPMLLLCIQEHTALWQQPAFACCFIRNTQCSQILASPTSAAINLHSDCTPWSLISATPGLLNVMQNILWKQIDKFQVYSSFISFNSSATHWWWYRELWEDSNQFIPLKNSETCRILKET